jgi:hypothetical protein
MAGTRLPPGVRARPRGGVHKIVRFGNHMIDQGVIRRH